MLTHQDIDLIHRDTALRQLRCLLDRDQYAPRLTSAAPEPDAAGAKLTYLRYKPGINCVAGYEYAAAGATRFAYTKIFSENQRDKSDKFFDQAGARHTAGDLVFSFFPIDSRLRSLGKMDGGVKERSLVERVFSDRGDLWCGQLKAIRYKPERRYVARLERDGQDVAVLKMHTGNSYTRLRNSNKSFKSRENLKLARRIGHSDRHRVLAFEWLSGQLLSDALRVGTVSAHELIPVGQALAHIHAQTSDRLATQRPNMQAERIESVAQQVSYLYPSLASRLMKVGRQINVLLLMEPWSYVPTHGDFYAKQILIDEDLVGVLDFDESAYDDPMSDLGNFFAHLERDKFRFDLSAEKVEDYRQALQEGYAREGLPINDRRIALFFAANLFKLLPHPFRFREAEWPEQTRQLLNRVERVLARATDSKHILQPQQGAAHDASTATSVVVPTDPALPFLRIALDEKAAWPAVSEPLKQRFSDCEMHGVARAKLRRHKIGRRCLIEYAIPLRGPSGAFTMLEVLGKARRNKMDCRTHDLTQCLWDGNFHSTAEDGVFVPEPLGSVPAFNMWLQKKIEGYTATNYLEGPAAAIIGRNIAFALFKLHTKGAITDRFHSMHDELTILENRLTQVAVALPHFQSRLAYVLTTCKKLGAHVSDAKPQPIHRDFYPDNVLISENGIGLLDLDLYSMGDPALDAGNFIGHVIEYSLRKHGDPYRLKPCCLAFEEAYVALAGDSVQRSIGIYTTLSLARHIQISTLFEDRLPFTENLLVLCEKRLANQAEYEPTS